MNRFKNVDYLKTIAIFFVLLFHIGILKNGYLGVDVFFVIGGFLFARSNLSSFKEKTFKPFQYIIKKVASYWPLIIFISLLSLTVGYFVMLPDDYENLAESVVASLLFANNILQAITTKDYWDIVNTYKPLMHTWYIGVFMQILVFLIIIIYSVNKVTKKELSKYVFLIMTIISFALYILPIFTSSDKFYYFPFRIYEFTLGALIVYLKPVKLKKCTTRILEVFVIALFVLLFFKVLSISDSVARWLCIISTFWLIYSCTNNADAYENALDIPLVFTMPGRYSYYIYMCHQFVIAFLYYSLFEEYSTMLLVCAISVTFCISCLTVYLQKRINKFNSVKIVCISAVFALIIGSYAFYIFLRAGVVRDVPELDINASKIHRNMHAEYVDIPYQWNKDFSDENKVHVLVIGDSFGRDFANILYESQFSSELELSYILGTELADYQSRLEKADYIFYGSDSWEVPESIKSLPAQKLYIVGNKRFGKSNGIIFFNRNKEWYHEQKVTIPKDDLLRNSEMIKEYGTHYIDLISPLLMEGKVPVFTEDGYFISQDCRHLTKQGAKYYAKILDLAYLFKGAIIDK